MSPSTRSGLYAYSSELSNYFFKKSELFPAIAIYLYEDSLEGSRHNADTDAWHGIPRAFLFAARKGTFAQTEGNNGLAEVRPKASLLEVAAGAGEPTLILWGFYTLFQLNPLARLTRLARVASGRGATTSAQNGRLILAGGERSVTHGIKRAPYCRKAIGSTKAGCAIGA